MVLLCKKTTGNNDIREITVLQCRGMDSMAVIPDKIEDGLVTEFSPYLFSQHGSYEEECQDCFWWSDTDGRINERQALSLSVLKGGCLDEIHLPSSLKKVGAYGFYNCEKLRKLEVYSHTLDWGTGVFTGCSGIKELIVHVDENQKSCLKEILNELRQTLSVTYLGEEEARLIFSEFFEEAVENTPARILVTNTHGCGKQYRNAFVSTQFQFGEYDSLFPHVQIQETEELAASVALGRLLYPCQLSMKHQKMYEDYLNEHAVTAACLAVKCQDMDGLQWLMNHLAFDSAQMEKVIQAAGSSGRAGMVSYLMDEKKKKGNVKRRRFTL